MLHMSILHHVDCHFLACADAGKIKCYATTRSATMSSTDALDVTSLQEYMQFASVTDSLTAELGGRGNRWRPLEAEGTCARPIAAWLTPVCNSLALYT